MRITINRVSRDQEAEIKVIIKAYLIMISFLLLICSIILAVTTQANISLLFNSLAKGSAVITKEKFNQKSNNIQKKTKETFDNILPKLLPHKDKCYLMEFHHDDCDHAEQMEPVVRRLEEDLDTDVRRINISRRREFQALLHAVGHDECGSFPFYYNRRTGQAVCGATSYLNLKL